jgi:hypothetical protein
MAKKWAVVSRCSTQLVCSLLSTGAVAVAGCGGSTTNLAPLIIKPDSGVVGHTLAGTVFKARVVLSDGGLPEWLTARSLRSKGCRSELVLNDSVAESFGLCLEPNGLGQRSGHVCQRGLSVTWAYVPSHAASVRLRLVGGHDVRFPAIVVEQPHRAPIAVMFQVLPRSSAGPISYAVLARDGSILKSERISSIAGCSVGASR